MDQLDRDARTAKELGFPSYGYYIASKYDPYAAIATTDTTPHKRHRKRRYTDDQLFRLWQEGYTDEQIGKAVGVSRQFVQRWRDQLELPSTSKYHIDTKKYRLTTLRDGTYIVVIPEETKRKL